MKLPWYLRQKPAVALIAGLGGVFTVVHLACAQPWAAGPPAPQLGGDFTWWSALAGSADGSRLVGALAAVYFSYYYSGFNPAPIYISTNAGASWTPTSCPVDMWQAVAASADGTKLVAVARGFDGGYGGTGLIYDSTDSGATWTCAVRADNWSSVASSSDGAKLVATSYYSGGEGLIYTSSDFGASWATTSAPRNDWVSVASSADGTKLVAVTDISYDGISNRLTLAQVYRSTDSGATWTQSSVSSNNWTCVGCSADGSRLVAATSGYYGAGGIYISQDSGASWNRTSAPSNSWLALACSADATTLVAAAANGGFRRSIPGHIYVSNDGGLTWTTGSPAANWTALFSSADGYRVTATDPQGRLFTLPYLGPWKVADATDNDWNSVACSADGTKVVAAASGFAGNYLYNSTNGGASWATGIAPSNVSWSCLASPSKGTRLVAAASASTNAYGGPIYVSTNAGASWTPTPAPNRVWGSVATSSDGTALLAASPENAQRGTGWGQVYLSSNAGAAWRPAPVPLDAWSSVACSSDGTKLLAASHYSGSGAAYDGAMFSSTNSGATWTQIAWADDWSALASSADGANLVAATEWNGDGLIYTSADGGATWTQTAWADDWYSVSSSADGINLVAATSYGSLVISTNSGATWAFSDPPAGTWSAVAASADGTHLVAVSSDGLIATLQIPASDPSLPPSPRLTIGRSGVNPVLSWLVPSTSFVLQQSSNLAFLNWVDVTNLPTLNLSNLHYGLTLDAPSGRGFYRLKQQ